jgi:hypothetical protein
MESFSSAALLLSQGYDLAFHGDWVKQRYPSELTYVSDAKTYRGLLNKPAHTRV